MKYVLSLILLVFLACGKPGVKTLGEETNLFQQNLRWSSLEAAAGYMDPASRTELLDYYGKWMDKTKIVEFAVLGTNVHPSRDKADLWVEFSYYEIIHETLMKRREKQTWVMNKKERKWKITSVE